MFLCELSPTGVVPYTRRKDTVMEWKDAIAHLKDHHVLVHPRNGVLIAEKDSQVFWHKLAIISQEEKDESLAFYVNNLVR